MSSPRSTLYCHVFIHLLFIFLISLFLGLCLMQPRCVFTVIFNDSDFEQVRDILAPLFFISAFVFNVVAVNRLLKQLASSQPGGDLRVIKQL